MLVITKGETGGAQSHLLSLCEALKDRAALQVVVGGASASISPLARSLGRAGVAVRALPALRNTLHPWAIAAAARALVHLIRQERPGLLHAHSSAAGVVTRLAAWLTRTPVIYTVHGFGFKPEAPTPQRQLAFLAEWTLAPLTRHMVCVSRHEQQLAERLPLPARRTSVIPNAVDDTSHRAAAGCNPMRVVMVARFADPKRQDLLLDALALIRDSGDAPPTLTLVGDGPGLAGSRDRARGLGLAGVDYTGDVPDVPKRLADHQVFVLVSDHEGLPISILEAMRAGLAIVASDLPGVRELVRHGEEALLVSNDAKALATALRRLGADPALRSRLGRAARRRYETLYTPGPMADAVHALYVEIAS